MQYVVHSPGGAATINLQATLSASSAGVENNYNPHHPIVCQSNLTFDEEGNFSCEHMTVPADDQRLIACLNHTISILLIELASAL